MTASITGVSHVGITVSDMDRAVAFYRDVLGWEQLFDERLSGPELDALTGRPGTSLRACGGRIGAGRVELMQFDGGPTEPHGPGLGLGTLSIEVDDIDACHTELSAQGVTVLGPPVELHGTRMFFVLDPDGQPIELVEYLPGGPAWGGAHR